MDLTTNRQMTSTLTNPMGIFSWPLFLPLFPSFLYTGISINWFSSLHFFSSFLLLPAHHLNSLPCSTGPCVVLPLPIFPTPFQATLPLGYQAPTQKLSSSPSNVSNCRAFPPVLSSVWKYLFPQLWLNPTHPIILCLNVISSERLCWASPISMRCNVCGLNCSAFLHGT